MSKPKVNEYGRSDGHGVLTSPKAIICLVLVFVLVVGVVSRESVRDKETTHRQELNKCLSTLSRKRIIVIPMEWGSGRAGIARICTSEWRLAKAVSLRPKA